MAERKNKDASRQPPAASGEGPDVDGPSAASDQPPEAQDETAEDKPKRRSSPETAARAKKEAVPAPRNDAGQVEVRARARYVRSAPRKARLVMHHIRGKRVADARAILSHTPRAASTDVLKLLNSAVANAENNFELDVDELKVSHAYVDEGPIIKRWRPRAYGRATRINKRTSHMTILLTTTGDEE